MWEKAKILNFLSKTVKIYKITYLDWIFQIIKNKLNAVDVDKFDHINRDTYKLGVPRQSFDYSVLFNSAKLINGNICYKVKDAFLFYELFQCRYRLFKEFYLHRVAKGIDLMIKDIFTEANSVYKFGECLYDINKYLSLKDSIINDILYSDKEELAKAKQIVKRIFTRDLYKFVGEVTINSSNSSYEKFIYLTEEDVLNCSRSLESNETQLKPGDIRILKLSLDFCKGDEDPINYIKFYKDKEMLSLNRSDISLLAPNIFYEVIVRVYVTDLRKLSQAKVAFQKFCNEKAGESPHCYDKDVNLNRSRISKSSNITPKKLDYSNRECFKDN